GELSPPVHDENRADPGVREVNRNDVYFLVDSAPNRISLRSSVPGASWTARNSSGQSVRVRIDPRDRRAATIEGLRTPGCIEVDDVESRMRIWFVRASITLRNKNSVSTERNPSWNATQRIFQDTYGAPSYNFTGLNLIQFDSNDNHFRGTFAGRRYGAQVELIGHVTPCELSETQMTFYLA